MNFGTKRSSWVYRYWPIPDEVFRPALMACIDRYGVVGVSALIRVSAEAVQHWRQGRRKAKLTARAAVVILASLSVKQVEALSNRLLPEIPLDEPVNNPKH